VGNNSLPVAELPRLIQSVHAALTAMASGVAPTAELVAQPPAVAVRKSVTPDYIVCLDDGRKFKSLKRHVAGLGMTPEQYREKWKLPSDYPMVAPNYAAVRSALALKNGLGQMHREAAGKSTSAVESKHGRGRPRKVSASAA
jgi:predicted transcriptional regulator